MTSSVQNHNSNIFALTREDSSCINNINTNNNNNNKNIQHVFDPTPNVCPTALVELVGTPQNQTDNNNNQQFGRSNNNTTNNNNNINNIGINSNKQSFGNGVNITSSTLSNQNQVLYLSAPVGGGAANNYLAGSQNQQPQQQNNNNNNTTGGLYPVNSNNNLINNNNNNKGPHGAGASTTSYSTMMNGSHATLNGLMVISLAASSTTHPMNSAIAGNNIFNQTNNNENSHAASIEFANNNNTQLENDSSRLSLEENSNNNNSIAKLLPPLATAAVIQLHEFRQRLEPLKRDKNNYYNNILNPDLLRRQRNNSINSNSNSQQQHPLLEKNDNDKKKNNSNSDADSSNNKIHQIGEALIIFLEETLNNSHSVTSDDGEDNNSHMMTFFPRTVDTDEADEDGKETKRNDSEIGTAAPHKKNSDDKSADNNNDDEISIPDNKNSHNPNNSNQLVQRSGSINFSKSDEDDGNVISAVAAAASISKKNFFQKYVIDVIDVLSDWIFFSLIHEDDRFVEILRKVVITTGVLCSPSVLALGTMQFSWLGRSGQGGGGTTDVNSTSIDGTNDNVNNYGQAHTANIVAGLNAYFLALVVWTLPYLYLKITGRCPDWLIFAFLGTTALFTTMTTVSYPAFPTASTIAMLVLTAVLTLPHHRWYRNSIIFYGSFLYCLGHFNDIFYIPSTTTLAPPSQAASTLGHSINPHEYYNTPPVSALTIPVPHEGSVVERILLDCMGWLMLAMGCVALHFQRSQQIVLAKAMKLSSKTGQRVAEYLKRWDLPGIEKKITKFVGGDDDDDDELADEGDDDEESRGKNDDNENHDENDEEKNFDDISSLEEDDDANRRRRRLRRINSKQTKKKANKTTTSTSETPKTKTQVALEQLGGHGKKDEEALRRTFTSIIKTILEYAPFIDFDILFALKRANQITREQSPLGAGAQRGNFSPYARKRLTASSNTNSNDGHKNKANNRNNNNNHNDDDDDTDKSASTISINNNEADDVLKTLERAETSRNNTDVNNDNRLSYAEDPHRVFGSSPSQSQSRGRESGSSAASSGNNFNNNNNNNNQDFSLIGPHVNQQQQRRSSLPDPKSNTRNSSLDFLTRNNSINNSNTNPTFRDIELIPFNHNGRTSSENMEATDGTSTSKKNANSLLVAPIFESKLLTILHIQIFSLSDFFEALEDLKELEDAVTPILKSLFAKRKAMQMKLMNKLKNAKNNDQNRNKIYVQSKKNSTVIEMTSSSMMKNTGTRSRYSSIASAVHQGASPISSPVGAAHSLRQLFPLQQPSPQIMTAVDDANNNNNKNETAQTKKMLEQKENNADDDDDDEREKLVRNVLLGTAQIDDNNNNDNNNTHHQDHASNVGPANDFGSTMRPHVNNIEKTSMSNTSCANNNNNVSTTSTTQQQQQQQQRQFSSTMKSRYSTDEDFAAEAQLDELREDLAREGDQQIQQVIQDRSYHNNNNDNDDDDFSNTVITKTDSNNTSSSHPVVNGNASSISLEQGNNINNSASIAKANARAKNSQPSASASYEVIGPERGSTLIQQQKEEALNSNNHHQNHVRKEVVAEGPQIFYSTSKLDFSCLQQHFDISSSLSSSSSPAPISAASKSDNKHHRNEKEENNKNKSSSSPSAASLAETHTMRLHQLINELSQAVWGLIREHKGVTADLNMSGGSHADSYSIVACWGAPLDARFACELACCSALRVLKMFRENFSNKFECLWNQISELVVSLRLFLHLHQQYSSETKNNTASNTKCSRDPQDCSSCDASAVVVCVNRTFDSTGTVHALTSEKQQQQQQRQRSSISTGTENFCRSQTDSPTMNNSALQDLFFYPNFESLQMRPLMGIHFGMGNAGVELVKTSTTKAPSTSKTFSSPNKESKKMPTTTTKTNDDDDDEFVGVKINIEASDHDDGINDDNARMKTKMATTTEQQHFIVCGEAPEAARLLARMNTRFAKSSVIISSAVLQEISRTQSESKMLDLAVRQLAPVATSSFSVEIEGMTHQLLGVFDSQENQREAIAQRNAALMKNFCDSRAGDTGNKQNRKKNNKSNIKAGKKNHGGGDDNYDDENKNVHNVSDSSVLESGGRDSDETRGQRGNANNNNYADNSLAEQESVRLSGGQNQLPARVSSSSVLLNKSDASNKNNFTGEDNEVNSSLTRKSGKQHAKKSNNRLRGPVAIATAIAGDDNRSNKSNDTVNQQKQALGSSAASNGSNSNSQGKMNNNDNNNHNNYNDDDGGDSLRQFLQEQGDSYKDVKKRPFPKSNIISDSHVGSNSFVCITVNPHQRGNQRTSLSTNNATFSPGNTENNHNIVVAKKERLQSQSTAAKQEKNKQKMDFNVNNNAVVPQPLIDCSPCDDSNHDDNNHNNQNFFNLIASDEPDNSDSNIQENVLGVSKPAAPHDQTHFAPTLQQKQQQPQQNIHAPSAEEEDEEEEEQVPDDVNGKHENPRIENTSRANNAKSSALGRDNSKNERNSISTSAAMTKREQESMYYLVTQSTRQAIAASCNILRENVTTINTTANTDHDDDDGNDDDQVTNAIVSENRCHFFATPAMLETLENVNRVRALITAQQFAEALALCDRHLTPLDPAECWQPMFSSQGLDDSAISELKVFCEDAIKLHKQRLQQQQHQLMMNRMMMMAANNNNNNNRRAGAGRFGQRQYFNGNTTGYNPNSSLSFASNAVTMQIDIKVDLGEE